MDVKMNLPLLSALRAQQTGGAAAATGGVASPGKAGGAEFAQSMHLWFDQDLMAFRLIFRMDGQPALGAAVSPKNGSSTRSHFATVAVRA